MGASDDTFVFRVAHVEPGSFDPLLGRGGPVARQHSIAELGVPCDLPTGIPPAANVISKRSAMTLRGTSLLDNIRIVDIERTRLSQPDAVRGRMNILADGRIGRFGWKAHSATLVEFMAEAFRDELGVTSPPAPTDLVSGCGTSSRAEADAVPLTSLVAFLDTIDPPAPAAACLTSAGAVVFHSVGCDTRHQPNMFGPGNSGPNPTTIHPFTDLLLHDMGPGLADESCKVGDRRRISHDAALARVGSRAFPPRRARAHDRGGDSSARRSGRGSPRRLQHTQRGRSGGADEFRLHLKRRVHGGCDEPTQAIGVGILRGRGPFSSRCSPVRRPRRRLRTPRPGGTSICSRSLRRAARSQPTEYGNRRRRRVHALAV
jgi:hypothetical protein